MQQIAAVGVWERFPSITRRSPQQCYIGTGDAYGRGFRVPKGRGPGPGVVGVSRHARSQANGVGSPRLQVAGWVLVCRNGSAVCVGALFFVLRRCRTSFDRSRAVGFCNRSLVVVLDHIGISLWGCPEVTSRNRRHGRGCLEARRRVTMLFACTSGVRMGAKERYEARKGDTRWVR